jgi:hypothetical protein
MTHHTGKTFTRERIVLDGNAYENCTFNECELVYSGGETLLDNVNVRDPSFTFGGPVMLTLGTLQTFYRLGGIFRELVEKIIHQIRQPPQQQPPPARPGGPVN